MRGHRIVYNVIFKPIQVPVCQFCDNSSDFEVNNPAIDGRMSLFICKSCVLIFKKVAPTEISKGA